MINNLPVKTLTHKDLSIEGYSRAAVQTYWRIPELKIGFDFGGQPWSFMGTPTWFVSHTHMDHLVALPVYVARRRMMKMEPPTIYLPEAAVEPTQRVLRLFSRMDRGRLPCTLLPLKPGDEIELSREQVVTISATTHTVPSLGFVVWERRRKLKPEFHGLPGEQIRDLRLGGTDVTTEVRLPRLAYLGDSSPAGLDACPDMFEAEVLIMELTFVSPRHRKDKIHKFGHMHLDDLLERRGRFHNELVIASHFSTRYHPNQIRDCVSKALPDMLDGRLHLWLCAPWQDLGNAARIVVMSPDSSTPRRVAVIGGGIAGLAAAHRLVELDPACEVTLFEAGARLGGVLSTLHESGFQVEQSADNFITTVPWGVNLCKRLGLGDRLVQTNAAYRRTFVVRRGRLHRLPDGFLMMAPTQLWPLAVTPILSPLGKLRAAMEYFIPPRTSESDESMAAFVRRRLGREVFDRLVEPLVSAVYAADLDKLSVLATLSRFREMEQDHGSLIRAMRHQMKNRPKSGGESGARYSMFVTLQDGLSSLVDAIAARLLASAVRLDTTIAQIERHGDKWQVVTGAAGAAPLPFDALILATPSPVAARLLQPIDALLAADLATIVHSGTAIVSLGYATEQIGHPMDGMGAVVPMIERSPILACSFSSRKYPHRAPDGKELLRVFVGGARHPELAEMDDAELRPLVLAEMSKLLRICGEPCYCNIAHWPGTMPQYHVGHKELVARIEARAAALPNLALAGNAYHGVGVPDCIHGGELAAEQILKGNSSAMDRR